MPSDDPIVSHGRGGAGNIAHDEKAYADGDIVREGPLGDQGNGPYSTGRGGAGNIDSPRVKATTKTPGDTDVIPETAIKPGNGEGYENYHVGRGGQGNVHHEHEKKEGEHGGLKDKVEHLFHKDK